MSYRPPGKAPLTDWGRFIVRRRKELDWSATQAFEAVREGLELAEKSRSAYLPFEYDRKPDQAQAVLFERVFGGVPGERDRAPIEPPTAPVPDLAAAIVTLAEELAALRLEREAWTRGIVAVLQAYEAGQVPAELLDALAPQLRGRAPR